MSCPFPVPDQEQREADPVRQTVDQTARKGQPRPHLLPDGADAGHPGRVPDDQALSFPGMDAQ